MVVSKTDGFTRGMYPAPAEFTGISPGTLPTAGDNLMALGSQFSYSVDGFNPILIALVV